MRRILFLQPLAFLLVVAIAAQTPKATSPQSSDKAAALKAATEWLVHLDAGDNIAAAEGYAEEVIALMNWPKHEEKVAAVGAALNGPRSDMGVRQVARTLRPDATKKATTCACNIRDGQFYVFTYDVKYSWDFHHIPHYKAGTEVLYMLLEKDGSWKPARIDLNITSQGR